MSIRTTVTLDDDVLERVKRESRSRGQSFKDTINQSFKDTINELLRTALVSVDKKPIKRTLKIKPWEGGYRPGLNYDSTEALLEYGEGPWHR